MTCDEWRLFLQDYIDGGLSDPARQAIDRHLSECGACFADARAHKQVAGFLEGQPILEPPPGLADRVAASIRPPSWRREIARVAAAAVLLAGLAGGAFLLVPREKIDPPVEMSLPSMDSIMKAWRP